VLTTESEKYLHGWSQAVPTQHMAEEFAGQTPPAAGDPMGNGALSPSGAAAAGDDDPMEVGSAKSGGDDGGLLPNSPSGGAEDANGFVENGGADDAVVSEAG
ncbi:unnamed protein product, partial [Ectocarpus fasciculatus]